nr:MAG TPA: hypothetical protein [Caudoviricetes sp.]
MIFLKQSFSSMKSIAAIISCRRCSSFVWFMGVPPF